MKKDLTMLYTVRPVQPDEMDDFWAYSVDQYGDDNVSFDTLKEWVSAFPRGWVCILKNDLLKSSLENHVGEISLFPITADFYQQMYNGTATEKEMTGDIIRAGIAEQTDATTPDYWYIPAISLRPQYRATMALPHLIRSTKKMNYPQTNMQKSVLFCAFAATMQGQRLLKKMNFTASPYSDDFYTLKQ